MTYRVSETTSEQQISGIVAARPWVRVSPIIIKATVGSLDFALVVLSLIGADVVYHVIKGTETRVADAFVISLLAGSLVVGTLTLKDGYNLVRLSDFKFQRRTAFIAWIVSFFVVGWIGFLTKSTAEFSRLAVTGGFLLGFFTILTVRQAFLTYLSQLVAAGQLGLQSAYIVFAGDPVDRRQRIAQMMREGTAITGVSDLSVDELDASARRSAIRSLVDDIRSTFGQRRCDAVYLFLPWSKLHLLDEMKRQFVRLPIPVYLLADHSVDKFVAGGAITISATPAFEIQRAPLSRFARGLKRGLDLTGAVGLLLFLSPLLIMIGTLIRFTSGGPILFRQTRRGFGGRHFEILKFRTMAVQSPEVKFAQATQNDPRVTPLGSVLRRTSIDELPQLWNVIRGEMSLVGPRPHPIPLDNRYDELIADYANRNHVKPGITGWAQINGYRGETPNVATMEARVTYDLWYINNWSIWLDLRILVQTLMVVPFDSRAY
ncbi:MAG: exopolysaccharide biosynthesis polyprenyl glycosylphosphotransferase [Bradyrhizobiaceae bacterium]|nr:exopolysaccharide biosynthesis polyprenyl glycosylphosphotransferase [Bradyrhizobiaceae bacterium]